MKNQFLSRFDANDLRKTIIYFVIALPLIIISLVFGFEKNDWAAIIFLFGIAFFFYAMLRLWGNAKYYGIMCIIIIIIVTLYLSVGIGILTRMQLNNLEKAIGEPIVFVGIVGVIVGIIGIFRFRKYD
jgi:membrane-associated HD superfamily phosphohydrolase